MSNKCSKLLTAVLTNTIFLVSFTANATGLGFVEAEALNSTASSDSGVINTPDDNRPKVLTDTHGNWIAVWSSYFDLGGNIGVDADIFYSRSFDNGSTWTATSVLNSNAPSDIPYPGGFDSGPALATDRQGNWIAVWYSNDSLDNTIGTDFDILTARSADNGATWSAPFPLNTNAATDVGQDQIVSIDTDCQGNWTAVWQSNDSAQGPTGSDLDIFYSRSDDNGATWTSPEALNTNASSDSGWDYEPRIRSDKIDNWMVVWYSYDSLEDTIGTDADVLISKSIDDGATWNAPQAIDSEALSDSGDDITPALATDAKGNWLVVWSIYLKPPGSATNDSDIAFVASSDGGVTWSDRRFLNSTALDDFGDDLTPDVSSDLSGNWVVLWTTYDSQGNTIGTDGDVLGSRSSNKGRNWTLPTPVKSTQDAQGAEDGLPSVANDEHGHWLCVWQSRDSLSGAVGGDFDILVTTMDRATDIDGDGRPDSCETDTGVYVDKWDTGTNPSIRDRFKVQKPKSGTQWLRGNRQKIFWKSLGNTGEKVRIELWHEGVFARIIKESTKNDGKLKWQVPENIPLDDGYAVYIKSVKIPILYRASRGQFEIVP